MYHTAVKLINLSDRCLFSRRLRSESLSIVEIDERAAGQCLLVTVGT